MNSDCEKLIQFDTTIIQNDITSRYSLFSYINRDNYEEMKKSYSASIPEYFTGDYDEFKQKRSVFTSLFVSSGLSEQSQSYYHHALSHDSSQNYAACLAKVGSKPISLWVDSFGEDTINISFRSGLLGAAKLNYTVTGAEAVLDAAGKKQEFGELVGAGSETVMFKYDKTKKFSIVVNAKTENQGKDSMSLEVPAVRNLVIKSEFKDIDITLWCAAGADGNTAGRPTWADGEFVAPAGFVLLPDTICEISREMSWPGIAHFQVSKTPNAAAPITRVLMHPYDFEGTNGDTQGKVTLRYRITAERKYLVDASGTAAAG
ncbi:MAG: hypothetical protein RR376_03555 [Janthinobacterium sp.]|jgi:hypothetical protein